MHELTLNLKSPQDTYLCGKAIGHFCKLPLMIALNGNLGAGKTALSQGIGSGFGIQEHLTSPSFALMHEYQGRRGKLYHLDIYRLETMDELWDLDFESVLSGPNSLILVEWKNKFAVWPSEPECLEINLEHQTQGRKAILHVPQNQEHLLEYFQTWQI